MRSLYAGVSGLKTHQTRMDVIGNNIANVNTVGYKSQSVTFSDMLYQTTSAASGPNSTTGTGGTNAQQIGLGVKTGAISTAISTAGAAETTNNPFDIEITGDSFFVVNNGSSNYFTRDGSFNVDASGNLVMSSTGYNVMGWQTDSSGNIKKDTVSALKVMSTSNMTYPAAATTKSYLSGIVDKNDTNVTSTAGKSITLQLYDSLGYSYTAKYAVNSTGTDGTYSVKLTSLTDDTTNKDVTSTAGAVLSSTSGGASATMYLHYNTSTGAFINVSSSSTDTTSTGTTAYLNFSGTNFSTVSMDFSATTNVNNSGTSTVAITPGDSSGVGTGRKVGTMTGVSISKDGEIYASYSNSQKKLLGQIAVAEFANASGLSKEGDNLYSETQNSGSFNGTGVDITSDGGYMTTGELEMSNVDLSTELTDMIVTQRGFQANSRIITVSDSMLEELVNLKRS
jgi:flagellar hook protein FlgE